MTEWDVKEIIRKEREANSPGCLGAIMTLLIFGLLIFMIRTAGEDYKDLKERVKQLEAQVEKKDK
jgi:hypothetical protein